MAITMEGLTDALVDVLEAYSDEVISEMQDAAMDAADCCVEQLQATSPELTGAYAKGWTSEITSATNTGIRVKVHNATDWQLTHLLEDGHANVSGGRTAAHPHIAAAAEQAAAKLEANIKIKVGRK